MDNKYQGPYKDRLIEIDNRIADLREHIIMWGKAHGGKMIMQANGEIKELQAEKERILDGTQERIDQIEDKIRELNELKAQCSFIKFIKKWNLSKEIKDYEIQKSNFMKKRK